MPGGPTLKSVYEELRDEMLLDLERALPVDMVLLCLHGAMAAQGYEDVEGDILEHVRSSVGPDAAVGAELDLHCNVTPRMVSNATALVTYKEWPHKDIATRAADLFNLVADAASGKTKPTTATYDCRIIGTFPTADQPMRGFVDRMSALEGKDCVLSVSFASGYPWGDAPCMTARTMVITDGDREKAQRMAEMLGREFWGMREAVIHKPEFDIDGAIDHALSHEGGPYIFADPADNLLCGCPADATYILARVLERGVQNVAFGPIYDPMSVEACAAIGAGASMRLRIGGKLDFFSGFPADVPITVVKLLDEPVQHLAVLGNAPYPMGHTAWVKTAGDVDIILTSKKVPALSPDVFVAVGLDIRAKKMVFCKMWQHGKAGFASVAKETHIIDAPGAGRLNYAEIPYRYFRDPYWPKVADPFQARPPARTTKGPQ
jgi:microcystin degradation protein MlrC